MVPESQHVFSYHAGSALTLSSVFFLPSLLVKPEPIFHGPAHSPTPLWKTFSSSSVTDASLLCVVKTKECIYCNSIVQQIAVGIIETHLLLWQLCELWAPKGLDVGPHVLFTLLHSLYLAPNSVVAPLSPANDYPNTNPSRGSVNAFSKISIKLIYLFPPQLDHSHFVPRLLQ